MTGQRVAWIARQAILVIALTLVGGGMSLPTPAHADHCQGIPDRPDREPDRVEYNSVLGLVEAYWTISTTKTLEYVHFVTTISRQAADDETIEINPFPLFYIMIEKGHPDTVWVDRGLEGKCEQIKRYHGLR